MFKVPIPATSANMGPAFDTAGVALSLYNTVEVYTEDERDFGGSFKIESVNNIDERISANRKIPLGENNLIYSTIKNFASELKKDLPRFYIRQIDKIPLARGLGSSAACITAGLLIANELTGANLSKKELLSKAVKIEGHPDNVAPAFLGNMAVGVVENNSFEYVGIDIPETLEFIALIPDFPLATSAARGVLPKAYTREQTVFNCSHTALLDAAMMKGDIDALALSLKDEIHQPYRKILIHGMEEIINKASSLGAVGGFLSGAGPTVMIINRKGNDITKELENTVRNFKNFWLVKPLEVDRRGAILIKQ